MLDEVIEWAGGRQVDLARRVGVSKEAVSAWVDRGGLPPLRAIQVEQMSSGKLRAVDTVDMEYMGACNAKK